jgi:hypothetical protein
MMSSPAATADDAAAFARAVTRAREKEAAAIWPPEMYASTLEIVRKFFPATDFDLVTPAVLMRDIAEFPADGGFNTVKCNWATREMQRTDMYSYRKGRYGVHPSIEIENALSRERVEVVGKRRSYDMDVLRAWQAGTLTEKNKCDEEAIAAWMASK